MGCSFFLISLEAHVEAHVHWVSIIRGCSTIMVSYLLLCAAIIVALVFGLPYRILIDPWMRRFMSNPFRLVPRVTTALIMWLGFRIILGTRLSVEGGAERAEEGDCMVCIGNHPSIAGLPPFFWYALRHVHGRMLVIGKWEVGWTPLGWALWALDSVIFINRNHTESALRAIRRGLRGGVTERGMIFIFPDQRRPTAERIAKDIERFRESVPDADQWLRHTMMPRDGGTWTTIDALATSGLRPRIIRIANGFTIADEGLRSLPSLVNATFHIHVRELIVVPSTRQATRSCLVREWQWINVFLEVRRSSMSMSPASQPALTEDIHVH
jgi:1-acyl-sn-glycerol-3-phosphate acyltransferase